MFRSQEFCPEMLAIVFLIQSLPLFLLPSLVSSQFLSSLLWPMTWLPQCKSFGEYPETSRKTGVKSYLRKEGRLWTLRRFAVGTKDVPGRKQPLQGTQDTCPIPSPRPPFLKQRNTHVPSIRSTSYLRA